VIQGLMVDEGDSDDEDAALAKPLLRSQQLQRLALTGGDSMYVPVRLDWLAAAPQLQHLTACVIQSGQVSWSLVGVAWVQESRSVTHALHAGY
jgi:hypothetical protein